MNYFTNVLINYEQVKWLIIGVVEIVWQQIVFNDMT